MNSDATWSGTIGIGVHYTRASIEPRPERRPTEECCVRARGLQDKHVRYPPSTRSPMPCRTLHVPHAFPLLGLHFSAIPRDEWRKMNSSALPCSQVMKYASLVVALVCTLPVGDGAGLSIDQVVSSRTMFESMFKEELARQKELVREMVREQMREMLPERMREMVREQMREVLREQMPKEKMPNGEAILRPPTAASQALPHSQSATPTRQTSERRLGTATNANELSIAGANAVLSFNSHTPGLDSFTCTGVGDGNLTCSGVLQAADIVTAQGNSVNTNAAAISALEKRVDAMSFTSMPVMCQGFMQADYCPTSSWAGAFEDLFTPDEWCKAGKKRTVTMSGGGLVVGYANCDGDGGYNHANSTMPNLVRSSSTSCSATVSFKGEFAPGTTYYDVSQNGALDFILTMGTFNNARVIKWSGLHKGLGGPWLNGATASATMCDNFWLMPTVDAMTRLEVKVAAIEYDDLSPMCDTSYNGFQAAASCSLASWVGTYHDLFTPSGECKTPYRSINWTNGELFVDHQQCDQWEGGTWAYDASNKSFLVISPGSCTATVSFANQHTTGPYSSDAAAGAFNFTLTLGSFRGAKMVRWTGMYDGKGGPFGSETVAPSVCDNFWLLTGNSINTPPFTFTDDSSALEARGTACAAFVPATTCTLADWAGQFTDLFTPDVSCSSSARSVDFNGTSMLVINMAACDGSGGYIHDAIMPMLQLSSSTACSATVNFNGEFTASSALVTPFLSPWCPRDSGL